MTEQEAFARLQEGDREALAWIYQNNRDIVAHYFMKHNGISSADARELVVDIVMRFDGLMEKGRYPRLEAQVSTILIEIGKNVVKEVYRKQEKERKEQTEWQEYRDFVEHTEGVENELEATTFDELLDNLPEMVQNMDAKCANVLNLYYWQNKSDREIAFDMMKMEGAIPSNIILENIKNKSTIKEQIDARTATVKTKRWDCIKKLKSKN